MFPRVYKFPTFHRSGEFGAIAINMDDEKKYELTNIPSVSEGQIDQKVSDSLPSSNVILIQDAIESIGMGRYQWQLMVSCGFGFVVDQV